MTLKELVQRERVSFMECQKTLHQILDDFFTKQQERLDNTELRLEKEALTNGKISIPLAVQAAAETIPILEATDIAPSLKTNEK